MNDPVEQAAPRQGLFRRIAIARYQAPIPTNTPWLLNPWRSAPLWLAAALILGAALCWL